MTLNINKFLNTISSINESINILLEDHGIIVEPGNAKRTEVEYTIYKNEGEYPNDGGNYITEKEAQTYDINKKAGDTIIIEEVDMSELSEAELLKWFKDNDISAEDAEGMAVAGTSSKVYRFGGKVYRFSKTTTVAVGRLALLRKTKDLPNSACWCAKLFDKWVDPDGNADKPAYIAYLNGEGYLDSIIENFEDNWDKCDSKYGKKIRKEENRDEVLTTCTSVEDWYGDAESVLDSIISKLQSYYQITGIKTKKKGFKGGANKSIGEYIGGFKKIQIYFTEECKCPAPPCASVIPIANPNDVKVFKIIAFKSGGDTVTLKGPGGSSDKWVFQFTKKELHEEQSGNLYKWESSGPPHSKIASNWKGKITKLWNP
jgi:hypothetical protein